MRPINKLKTPRITLGPLRDPPSRAVCTSSYRTLADSYACCRTRLVFKTSDVRLSMIGVCSVRNGINSAMTTTSVDPSASEGTQRHSRIAHALLPPMNDPASPARCRVCRPADAARNERCRGRRHNTASVAYFADLTKTCVVSASHPPHPVISASQPASPLLWSVPVTESMG